jgi:predicted cupin superfamily sugar epimerase
MTADEVKKILGLQPHLREGGFYVRTYESGEMLQPTAFADGRYYSPRHTGTAIYYLLEPGTFSEMHSLRSDELFHFYLGDPVEMLQLAPDGTGQTILLGPDMAAGMRLQHTVPGGMWQGSRLVPGGQYALLGTTMAPGFDSRDYESGRRDELSAQYPHHAPQIARLTR